MASQKQKKIVTIIVTLTLDQPIFNPWKSFHAFESCAFVCNTFERCNRHSHTNREKNRFKRNRNETTIKYQIESKKMHCITPSIKYAWMMNLLFEATKIMRNLEGIRCTMCNCYCYNFNESDYWTLMPLRLGIFMIFFFHRVGLPSMGRFFQ